jgi:hypothetical protein
MCNFEEKKDHEPAAGCSYGSYWDPVQEICHKKGKKKTNQEIIFGGNVEKKVVTVDCFVLPIYPSPCARAQPTKGDHGMQEIVLCFCAFVFSSARVFCGEQELCCCA